jgi:hypothetical protein
MARIRRVESQREKEQALDEFVTRGFKIKEQGQYSATVKDTDYGDPPIHGFLFLFSLIASVFIVDAVGLDSALAWVFAGGTLAIYAAYSYLTAEEVVIKVESDAPA